MSGSEIYRRICDAHSIDAEVSRLSRAALAAVAEHLADMAPKGGVPAQIWGAVAVRLNPPERRKTSRRKTQDKEEQARRGAPSGLASCVLPSCVSSFMITDHFTTLAQAAADAGNLINVSAGAGALAAIGTAVVLIVRAARERIKQAKVTLQEPVPDIPVTMTRKYNPPTFSQHMEVVRRVSALESTVLQIRREAAENYKELMQAGEVRTNRMLDKMDDVARGFHSRVDDLMAAGAKPKPRNPKT